MYLCLKGGKDDLVNGPYVRSRFGTGNNQCATRAYSIITATVFDSVASGILKFLRLFQFLSHTYMYNTNMYE